VDKRGIAAACLAGVYLIACVWALWDRLGAVVLLAAVSPVAAGFMFPKGTSVFSRMLIGALIDSGLAALAFVPVLGDLIDLGAAAAALVLLVARSRRFASSVPGGLACAVLWAFVWLEAGFLPHRLSVSGPHHGFWFYPAIVVASVLAGGMILTALTLLLGLLYDGDRAKAIFRTMGSPWYLITLFLTIFLPSSHVKHARDSADLARGA
jgi:hypothetical protein